MEKIISGATLLLGENLEETRGYAVWMKNGFIHRVLPENSIPNGIPVENLGGAYLLPGLIDLHVHIMWDGSPDPVNTHEKETKEQMLIRSVANAQIYLKSGVTTIRDLGSIDDIALHVAAAISEGIIEGPRIIASGKTITMTGGHDPFWAKFVDGKDAALKATREQIYKNAQVVKVSATGGVYGRREGEKAENSELSFEELKVVCDEAHRFGLKVASHAIGREGILNSIEAGVDTIEHGHYLDAEIVGKMIEKKVSWIPTLYIYQQIASLDGVPEYAREKAENITNMHVSAFQKFFDSGILIGAGSDAGACFTPHPSIIEEMEKMSEYVDGNRDILKTATVNAGKILGLKVGQITEGYVADFLVVPENPLNHLSALRQVQAVYINGIGGVNDEFE